MARSYKKNPGFSIPGMGDWKREVNRSFRRNSHNILQKIENGDDDAIDSLPDTVKEVSDIWNAPSDGVGGAIHSDPFGADWIKPHKIIGK